MSDGKVVVSVAPSLGTMLLVLFIALKLTNVINWGWIWVLSPLWIPFTIILGIGLVAFVIYMLFAIFK